jgi:ubiquitin-conjugating enzyme E2 variant
MILIQILALILLADLITGVFHWLQDAYGNPNWRFLGKWFIIPNIDHHKHPRRFLAKSMFGRIVSTLVVSFFLLLIYHLLFGICWQAVICVGYGTLANEIHAIAHRTDKENGKIICFLQDLGIIQSRKMHGLHHTSPYDINYCVMTNFLNPILNKIKFWHKLELLIYMVFGVLPIRSSNDRDGV